MVGSFILVTSKGGHNWDPLVALNPLAAILALTLFGSAVWLGMVGLFMGKVPLVQTALAFVGLGIIALVLEPIATGALYLVVVVIIGVGMIEVIRFFELA